MMTWPQRFERARFIQPPVPQPRVWWKPWTWKTRPLGQGFARGFSPDDLKIARDWNGCAFGELYTQLGRPESIKVQFDKVEHWIRPKDEHLVALGSSFYSAIEDDDVDAAEFYYDAIRQRLTQLMGLAPTQAVDRFLASLNVEVRPFTPGQ